MKRVIGYAFIALAVLCGLTVLVHLPELFGAAGAEFRTQVAFLVGPVFWNGVLLLAGVGLFRLGRRYVRAPPRPRWGPRR